MFSDEDIASGVREEVASVLSLELDEVQPQSRFFTDLGGESIDLLELSFRCEKRFAVKVDFAKMLSPDEIATDGMGRLTAEGLAAIRRKLSIDVPSRFEGQSRLAVFQELLTVGAITDFIRRLLGPQAVPAMA